MISLENVGFLRETLPITPLSIPLSLYVSVYVALDTLLRLENVNLTNPRVLYQRGETLTADVGFFVAAKLGVARCRKKNKKRKPIKIFRML